MRRTLPIFIAVFVLVATCIVVAKTVMPLRKSTNANAPAPSPRIVNMTATGQVADIIDSTVWIERSAKGNMETMELYLDKPEPHIKGGDKVKLSYVERDGKHIVSKITKVIPKTKPPIIVAQNKDRVASGDSSAASTE